jgi:nucleoside-diphosphate-sugar epimerase
MAGTPFELKGKTVFVAGHGGMVGAALMRRLAQEDVELLTVKRFHYDTHDELRSHLAGFVSAYNFAKRLKTLKGLTPYEHICRAWTKEPERFTLNPLQQMPGLNS